MQLVNKYKLGIMFYIIKDNQKSFLIEKKKSQIFKNQINKLINTIKKFCKNIEKLVKYYKFYNK